MPEVKQIHAVFKIRIYQEMYGLEIQITFLWNIQFFWVDSTFTDIFSLPLVNSGDVQKILADPHHVIISEITARKYFGTEDPVGKIITYVRDGMNFRIYRWVPL